MSFAIPFSTKFQYPNDDIQWNINYKPEVKKLDNFITQYGTHRINLVLSFFDKRRDTEIILALLEKHKDKQIVTCVPKYTKEIEDFLHNQGIPHYYNEFVTDWDKFNGFLSLDITDIFVSENLLFNLTFLKDAALKNNKKLRCFCNFCQSSWKDTPSIKTFFIRPDDITLYEDFIDTFEFYINPNFPESINTLYNVYAKEKFWFGKLKEIIVGYNGEEDSRFFLPLFGEKRLNCNKKCVSNLNSSCSICDRIVDLTNTLEDIKLMPIIDK